MYPMILTVRSLFFAINIYAAGLIIHLLLSFFASPTLSPFKKVLEIGYEPFVSMPDNGGLKGEGSYAAPIVLLLSLIVVRQSLSFLLKRAPTSMLLLARSIHIAIDVYVGGLITYIILSFFHEPATVSLASLLQLGYTPFLAALHRATIAVSVLGFTVDPAPEFLLLCLFVVHRVSAYNLAMTPRPKTTRPAAKQADQAAQQMAQKQVTFIQAAKNTEKSQRPEEPLSLQSQLDPAANGPSLVLSPVEYTGPAKISRPVIIDGKGATIWARKGPVICIESNDVVLRNMRVEVTGDFASMSHEAQCAILVSDGNHAIFDNVEVRGTVIGIPQQEGDWLYPPSLKIGKISRGQEHEFLIRIVVPTACEVRSDISGVSVEPSMIRAGTNTLHVHVERISLDVILNGNISLLRSGLIRPMQFSAHVVNGGSPRVSAAQTISQPDDQKSVAAQIRMQTSLRAP